MTRRTLAIRCNRGLAGVAIACFAIAPNAVLAESVQDNGLSAVGASGLASLRTKVSGRDDLVGGYRGETLSRFDTESDGTYFFTEPGAMAHAFAMYCGQGDGGGLEVRAWSAGDNEPAEALKAAITRAIRQAGECAVEPE